MPTPAKEKRNLFVGYEEFRIIFFIWIQKLKSLDHVLRIEIAVTANYTRVLVNSTREDGLEVSGKVSGIKQLREKIFPSVDLVNERHCLSSLRVAIVHVFVIALMKKHYMYVYI